MAALPKSPAGNRRSSSGSGLRPVIPKFGLDDGSAVDDLEDTDELELGPAPRGQSTPFAEGAGVDEVEYAYGYVPFSPYFPSLLIIITGSEVGEYT